MKGDRVNKVGGGSARVLLLILLGSMLACVATLSFLPALLHPAIWVIARPLEQIVPAELSGWSVRTLPIADSEEGREQTKKVLRYDDVIYRTYQRGAMEVQIYAAYWHPGSVPYGQAGVHTPDTCWIASGWTRLERQHRRILQTTGGRLKPCETGVFQFQGQQVDVVFWHLVGGVPYGYEQFGWRSGLAGYVERLPHLLQDLRTFGFDLRREQVFLRISATVPLERLWPDADFQRLVESLAPLGIFETRASLTTATQPSSRGKGD